MRSRFFIIGAAKCGTTTVDAMLRMHPEIYMSPIKEPNYFSTDIDPARFNDFYREHNTGDTEAYFNSGELPQKHLDFIRDRSQYDRLFETDKSVKWLGESSTSYLYSSVAADNVYGEFPDAKIIVCLRDPVERLKSHLKMALQGGYITSADDRQIENDLNRPDQGWGISELFLPLGMYGEQLNRWYDLFPSSSVHVIFFDEIRNDQQKVWQDLCAFLNVSIFAHDSTVHENKSGIPRYPRLNAALKGSGGIKAVFDRMPESWKNRLKSGWHDRDAKVEIDEERWRAYYQSDIDRLEKLIGRSLDQWKN